MHHIITSLLLHYITYTYLYEVILTVSGDQLISMLAPSNFFPLIFNERYCLVKLTKLVCDNDFGYHTSTPNLSLNIFLICFHNTDRGRQ